MTDSNQMQKNSDDFRFAIVVRIEGHNSRALILRFAGITVALVTVAIKVALYFTARTH